MFDFEINLVSAPNSAAATNNSTPLVPPAAPTKSSTTAARELVANQSLSVASPTALDLSNIATEERPARPGNGSMLRLERQNATIESPQRADTSTASVNDSIVDALERNTSQLREMFSNLSQHVEEIERKMQENQERKDTEEVF